MNSLASQKELLLAESELNRAQLLGAMIALTPRTRRFTDRTISVSVFASSAVMLMREVADSRSHKPGGGAGKLSRMQTVMKIGGMVSALWLAFFPQEHNQHEK